MTVFVDPDRTAATQMARDHELFERALRGEACARLYEWDQTWVTLGRFQEPSSVFADSSFTNWTRRETGGAAVLHGHDVTVAVAVPLLGSEGVRGVYRRLVRPLVLAFQDAGQDAVLGEDAGFADRRQGAYCFLGKSQNDVVSASTGQKLSGCALKVTRVAALLQASIPIRDPLVKASQLINDAVLDEWVEIAPANLTRLIAERIESLG